jgi:hypothetical protein
MECPGKGRFVSDTAREKVDDIIYVAKTPLYLSRQRSPDSSVRVGHGSELLRQWSAAFAGHP